MQALVPFSLPISGLRDGLHTFRMPVDDEFFRCFEGSVIQHGQLEVVLTLDKRPNLMVLHFQIKGVVRVDCDRCLEPFDLPVDDEQDLMVKYDLEARDDVDVIYIQRETTSLDVSKYVYEFIHLAVPLAKTHDLAGAECDPEMLQYIQRAANGSEEAPDTSSPDSVWSDLKKWNEN